MRILIRYLESRGAGRESRESVFSGDVATIGRGTDQVIQIADRRIPLNHSRLTLSGGRLRLAAAANYSFQVNDRPARNATLAPGDIIDISGHRIVVMLGDEDVDLTLEVDAQSVAVEKLRERFTTRLWQLRDPTRPASWLLFLSVILTGLLIPAAGFFVGFDTLRQSSLPDDAIWLTGELHSTHAFMGKDCSACHSEPGVPAKDEDCLSCHRSVAHHLQAAADISDFRASHRCGDCHWEHSDLPSIVRTDQASCTDCHGQLSALDYQRYDLKPASDFLSDHPPFRISLVGWQEASAQWRTRRVDPVIEQPVETSNLIFNHALHLDPGGIDSPQGEIVMACADCHSVAQGERITQVTMEQHCAACHQLTFDPTTPDRVVPHGAAAELMRVLREYYAFQFIDGGDANTESIAPPPQRQARRPGQQTRDIRDIAAADRDRNIDSLMALTGEARTFIDASVASAAENLFERQTCVLCHEMRRTDDPEVPWQIKPVALNEAWFPQASFSHDSHKNMQCASCHSAASSVEATDVLMPEIDSCRTCHGGEHASLLLQSTCTTCHQFHLEGRASMAAGFDFRAHPGNALNKGLPADSPASGQP